MCKAFVISAAIGMMVAGAATTALAKPGDQYTLYAGGCLPGDKVNPVGSPFHCTEKLVVNPNGGAAAKTAIKVEEPSSASKQPAKSSAPATSAK